MGRRINSVLIIVALFAIVSSGTVEARQYSAAENAIVSIYLVTPSRNELYQGTGFVVEKSGIIATNYHVIFQKLRNDDYLMIVKTKDGAFFARTLTTDINYDVALIKIDRAEPLDTIELDTTCRVKKGEAITILGHPFGGPLLTSEGLITNTLGVNQLIQITAPVSHGNSGSPVLNSEGKAIGIVTFSVDGVENLNFAMHIRHLVRLLELWKQEKNTLN